VVITRYDVELSFRWSLTSPKGLTGSFQNEFGTSWRYAISRFNIGTRIAPLLPLNPEGFRDFKLLPHLGNSQNFRDVKVEKRHFISFFSDHCPDSVRYRNASALDLHLCRSLFLGDEITEVTSLVSVDACSSCLR